MNVQFRRLRVLTVAMLFCMCLSPGSLAQKKEKDAKDPKKESQIEKLEPLLGWELEFSNKRLDNSNHGELLAEANSTNDAAREKWINIIRKSEKKLGFEVTDMYGWFNWYDASSGEIYETYAGPENDDVLSYRVKFKDGFWFQLSYDPNCVEVQIKPSTAAELAAHAKEVQFIYDTAKQAGLKPPKVGETHVHVGIEAAFNHDIRLFRNYMVDAVNHAEMPFLFPEEMSNTPPIASLPEENFEAFDEIIAQIDEGRIKDILEAAKKIRKDVYTVAMDDVTNEDYYDELYNKRSKYQHHNVSRIKKNMAKHKWTAEDRCMPHPKNAEEVALLSKLKDARVKFLNKNFKDQVPLRKFNPKADPKLKAAMWKRYVEESGLKWADYKRFLPKKLQKAKLPQVDFNAFDAERLPVSCEKIFPTTMGRIALIK